MQFLCLVYLQTGPTVIIKEVVIFNMKCMCYALLWKHTFTAGLITFDLLLPAFVSSGFFEGCVLWQQRTLSSLCLHSVLCWAFGPSQAIMGCCKHMGCDPMDSAEYVGWKLGLGVWFFWNWLPLLIVLISLCVRKKYGMARSGGKDGESQRGEAIFSSSSSRVWFLKSQGALVECSSLMWSEMSL